MVILPILTCDIVIFLLTDIIFAALPILFVRVLQHPRREKIVLCLLMGMGLLCAISVIPKLISIRRFSVTAVDFTYDVGSVTLWAQVEIFTGVIAASIPGLKSLFERILHRGGFLTSASARSIRRSEYSSQPGQDLVGHVILTEPTASVYNYARASRRTENWPVAEVSWLDMKERCVVDNDQRGLISD